MYKMDDKRIQEIALQYGYDAQSRQCIEEMAELTQAINKFWRKDLKCEYGTIEESRLDKESEAYINLIGEIADVEIMLEQMKEMLHCENRVKEIREEKLKRQIERIRERYREKEEMTSTEAIGRLERYMKLAENDGISKYDIKLHNACIKALQEKIEREEKKSGV